MNNRQKKARDMRNSARTHTFQSDHRGCPLAGNARCHNPSTLSMYVLLVCVGHVFFVSYELYREHQWERNLTKHHRNTIAPSSCYTPLNKIIATVTKQLASQIIEPIFLIYVDLRWLWDLHFRYRGLLLVSLGALGLTFGTTQGHQKDHLGPP